MTLTAFWIIVAVSTGHYNGGTLSQLDVRFPTEQSCTETMNQIKDTWGRTTLTCVEVTL